jgi:Domain of unknown function (DUF222)
MTTTIDGEPDVGLASGDAVLGYLSEVLTAIGGLSDGTIRVDDAVRIDRIAVLEKIKAAAAAAQAAEIVAFARSQVADQQQARVNYHRLGHGIAEQVGLATKSSGWHGARKLGSARDLINELPETLRLLSSGAISEYVAQLVATETSHLDPDVRRRVDGQLADDLCDLGPKQAAGLARRLAQAADPQGAVKRARNARSERRVTVRPAPDTMCWLTALLPVEDGVRCFAALTREADTARATGDSRSRGQIMADTAVEWLTGQPRTDQRPVELNLTVPLDDLLDPDSNSPGDIPGYGPIPAGLVDEILRHAGDQVWWRRLFTAPAGDGRQVLIGGDPTARRFTGFLAKLLRLRDGDTCREPYCDAPIRHLDHIQPRRHGGPTTYANGRGLCERHNYTRELPGWTVKIHRLDRHGQPFLIATTTPTGHTYLSRAPNPPLTRGRRTRDPARVAGSCAHRAGG